MNCLIIDDNKDIISTIKIIFNSDLPHCSIIGEAETLLDGIRSLNHLKPDLVFLDMKLPDGEGLEVLEHTNHKDFSVIPMTLHGKYAIDIINNDSIKGKIDHFISKPFKKSDLIKAVNDIYLKKNSTKNSSLQHNSKTIENTIKLTTSKEVYYPKHKDIVYARADAGGYTYFWIPTINNTSELYIQGTLSKYASTLPKHTFFKISQSYLINLHTVMRIDKEHMFVELKGTDKKLKITPNRKNDLFLALENLK